MLLAKTARCCLVVLAAIVFLSNLADNGRLDAPGQDYQVSIDYSFDNNWNTHRYPLKLSKPLFVQSLYWAGEKFSPPGNVHTCVITFLLSLPQFPGRISRDLQFICTYGPHSLTGASSGGLPL